jgi:hypothetical protein
MDGKTETRSEIEKIQKKSQLLSLVEHKFDIKMTINGEKHIKWRWERFVGYLHPIFFSFFSFTTSIEYLLSEEDTFGLANVVFLCKYLAAIFLFQHFDLLFTVALNFQLKNLTHFGSM